jgi:hypothetical protein
MINADLLIDPEFFADSHDIDGLDEEKIPPPQDEEYGTDDENEETMHNQVSRTKTDSKEKSNSKLMKDKSRKHL